MAPNERSREAGRGRAEPPRRLDPSWIIVQTLRFLARDPEAAERFFALSGLDAGALRAAAAEPGFGSAILDYLVEDTALLERFAAGAGCDPGDVMAAYEAGKARDGWQDP